MKHIGQHRPCSALLPRPGRRQSEVLTSGIIAYPARRYQFQPIVYADLIFMAGELFHRRISRVLPSSDLNRTARKFGPVIKNLSN
jgi:hypothetical protein